MGPSDRQRLAMKLLGEVHALRPPADEKEPEHIRAAVAMYELAVLTLAGFVDGDAILRASRVAAGVGPNDDEGMTIKRTARILETKFPGVPDDMVTTILRGMLRTVDEAFEKLTDADVRESIDYLGAGKLTTSRIAGGVARLLVSSNAVVVRPNESVADVQKRVDSRLRKA